MAQAHRKVINSYVVRLDAADSIGEIDLALSGFTYAAGFEHYLLRVVLRVQPGPGFDIRLTNYPDAWLARYSECGYRVIDPAAAHARSTMRPALLHQLPGSLVKPLLGLQFRDDVRDASLGDGLTLPLCTTALWGFLNLNTRKFESSRSAPVGDTMLFTCALAEAVSRVAACTALSDTYGALTKRERQVLFWAASGKTAWETSEILGITERTVIAHLAKSMRTIGCVNKAHLIGAVACLLDSDLELQAFRKTF